jgi:hypothetical protein
MVVIIGWLLWMTSPEALPPQAWAWLTITFTLSMLFASHGLAFLMMKHQRHQLHWFRAHVAFTVVVSVAWSLALWALPLKDNPALEFSLMAALVGIATTGSSLMVAFRWLSRLWPFRCCWRSACTPSSVEMPLVGSGSCSFWVSWVCCGGTPAAKSVTSKRC